MTEISITGQQFRDKHGRPVNSAGNFTETFCRSFRDIANNPHGDPRQTTHEIMGRDNIACSRPIRLWTARANRKKRDDVWRFYVDIGRYQKTGRFQMRKCRITGPREGDGEFYNKSDDGRNDDDNEDGDEGGDDDGGDNDGEYGGEDENDGGQQRQ